jgi:hypothetical protein
MSVYKPLSGSGRVGTLVALPDASTGTLVEIILYYRKPGSSGSSGVRFNSVTLNALLTDLSPSESVNKMPAATLSDDIYLYVCGDAPGQMSLSGTAYGGSGCGTGNMTHGLSNMLSLYRTFKLSNNYAPTVITFERGVSLSGYLTGFSGGGYNAQLDTFNFSLTYLMLPKASGQRAKAREVI